MLHSTKTWARSTVCRSTHPLRRQRTPMASLFLRLPRGACTKIIPPLPTAFSRQVVRTACLLFIRQLHRNISEISTLNVTHLCMCCIRTSYFKITL
jgi:hypothetical protein